MKYGYARVSTTAQCLDRQDDCFKDIEVLKVFEEKISGKNKKRPELKRMLAILKPGDEVIVCELSRLGRSIKDLVEIVGEIKEKGASFYSVKENIRIGGNASPTDELMFHIMGAFAEFERKQTLERQKEGIAAAKARGKTWGNKRQYFPENEQEIFEKYYAHEISVKEAAEMYGSMGSFQYQYKNWKKEKEGN